MADQTIVCSGSRVSLGRGANSLRGGATQNFSLMLVIFSFNYFHFYLFSFSFSLLLDVNWPLIKRSTPNVLCSKHKRAPGSTAVGFSEILKIGIVGILMIHSRFF